MNCGMYLRSIPKGERTRPLSFFYPNKILCKPCPGASIDRAFQILPISPLFSNFLRLKSWPISNFYHLSQIAPLSNFHIQKLRKLRCQIFKNSKKLKRATPKFSISSRSCDPSLFRDKLRSGKIWKRRSLHSTSSLKFEKNLKLLYTIYRK